MMKSRRYNRKTTGITISIFYEQYQLGKYNFDAPYQRDYNVWDDDQKAFLIDSIMKNFPMPPIFLEQKIDERTGKTTYDVIDGKQRLTTIIDFVENKVKLPEHFGQDIYGIELLNLKTFEEIREMVDGNDYVKDYLTGFWSYVISIEYIENPDYKVVDNIFDRLNRGGERLNEQELRKANYYDTRIYQDIEELRNDTYIANMLNYLNKNRLEDVSFITELYLLVFLESVIDGLEPMIDKHFKNAVEKVDEEKSEKILETFHNVKDIVNQFNLDYDKYRIKGPSHLYAIWYLAFFIHKNSIEINSAMIDKLNEFYTKLRNDRDDENIREYHKSMQSSTKFKYSRRRRVIALLNYFNYSFNTEEI